jgi:hypothetical protein
VPGVGGELRVPPVLLHLREPEVQVDRRQLGGEVLVEELDDPAPETWPTASSVRAPARTTSATSLVVTAWQTQAYTRAAAVDER